MQKCKKCEKTIDAVQSITEDSYTNCSELGTDCSGEIFRLIGKNVGIQFVGTGFYINDSKSSNSSTASKSKTS